MYLFNLAALYDCRKGIRQLMHHHLRHIVATRTRDVAVADAVLGDQDVVA